MQRQQTVHVQRDWGGCSILTSTYKKDLECPFCKNELAHYLTVEEAKKEWCQTEKSLEMCVREAQTLRKRRVGSFKKEHPKKAVPERLAEPVVKKDDDKNVLISRSWMDAYFDWCLTQ